MIVRPLVCAALAAALSLPLTARAEAPRADLIRQSYQLEAKGDLVGALAQLQRVTPSDDLTYFLALRTGWLSYLAGKWAEAEKGYRAAIAAAPQALEAQLGLTLPLMAAKRWREVEKATRAVLKRDAGNTVARLRLAQAHYALGNYDDAAAVYGKLVEEYPSEVGYRDGLGWSLHQLGKKAEARKTFDAVLTVAPDDASARQGRGAP